MAFGYMLGPVTRLPPIHGSVGTQTVDCAIRSDMLSQWPQSERFPEQPGRDEQGAVRVTWFEQLERTPRFSAIVTKKRSKRRNGWGMRDGREGEPAPKTHCYLRKKWSCE